ncbi:hypothetical protein AB4Z54_59245, partial [Streptomyces sp. MCAF7]
MVNAFYAAARTADLDALIQVLAPDVVQRTEYGSTRPPSVVRGAAAVAEQARTPRGGELRTVLVNGTVGALVTRDGQPYSVIAFTVTGDKIVRIDVIRNADRVRSLASSVLGPAEGAVRPGARRAPGRELTSRWRTVVLRPRHP